jgi:hypothetical protein
VQHQHLAAQPAPAPMPMTGSAGCGAARGERAGISSSTSIAAPASASSRACARSVCGGLVVAALHAVAAERVHRLRRQAQVGAHRDAALDQEAHRRGGPAAAFELDHVRAALHQAHRSCAAPGRPMRGSCRTAGRR